MTSPHRAEQDLAAPDCSGTDGGRRAADGVPIRLTVNGSPHTLGVPPFLRLLDVLRLRLRLTGTKEGCGEGECGACAVLVDGRLVNSCLIPIRQLEGATVTSIEGLSGGDAEGLSSLQRAMLAEIGVTVDFLR